MTWQTDFYGALTSDSTFNSSVNALALEYIENVDAPFAVYELISNPSTDDLENPVKAGDFRIQLSIWAKGPAQVETIVNNAIDAILASDLKLQSYDRRSYGFDSNGEVFGQGIDFIIWFDSP